MTAKLNEYRALNARWLALAEAAFYCGYSIPYFNKEVRPFVTEIGVRPVVFDKAELDRAMESKKIGTLPTAHGTLASSSSARRRSACRK